MALTDPVPSAALDVFQRNVQDLDRLINDGNRTVTTRTGTVLDSYLKAVEDALNEIGSLNIRGDRVASTAYAARDLWRDPATGTWYIVLASYVSTATVAGDVATGNVAIYQGVPVLPATFVDDEVTTEIQIPDTNLVTVMTLPLEASSRYAIEGLLTYSGNSTDDIRWSFGGIGGWSGEGVYVRASGAPNAGSFFTWEFGGSITESVTGPVFDSMKVTGSIRTNTNAGNVSWRVRKSINNVPGTPQLVRIGSWLRAQKLST